MNPDAVRSSRRSSRTPTPPSRSYDEKIVYQKITKGGGQDGMDKADKGGKVVEVGLRRCDVATTDSRYEIVPIVVDFNQAYKDAVAKLSPLDLLVLEIRLNRNDTHE